MKLSEIYHKYKILPTLQTHHLRVTAVAKLIADNSIKAVETDNIVITCLLHDMGNIIKFSFDYRPGSFEPEGVEYWKGVKDEFVKKYGNDEHKATIQIAKEIGVSQRVLDLLNNVGFGRAREIFESNDLNKMICSYADHRVAPMGVLSLEDRIREVIIRYKKVRPEYDTPENDKNVEILLNYYKQIEKEIFNYSKIKPEDINDAAIVPLMHDLIVQEDFAL